MLFNKTTLKVRLKTRPNILKNPNWVEGNQEGMMELNSGPLNISQFRAGLYLQRQYSSPVSYSLGLELPPSVKCF